MNHNYENRGRSPPPRRPWRGPARGLTQSRRPPRTPVVIYCTLSVAENCDTATARSDARFAEGIVSLIVYYVVFMIVGDFAAYFLGLFTEYEWGSQVSLIVFLALYFLFLWVSWVLAVRVTRPKSTEQQSS